MTIVFDKTSVHVGGSKKGSQLRYAMRELGMPEGIAVLLGYGQLPGRDYMSEVVNLRLEEAPLRQLKGEACLLQKGQRLVNMIQV